MCECISNSERMTWAYRNKDNTQKCVALWFNRNQALKLGVRRLSEQHRPEKRLWVQAAHNIKRCCRLSDTMECVLREYPRPSQTTGCNRRDVGSWDLPA